ncbi:MAG: membrane dipeptidase [Steroidobacteraceae bacterium]
MNRREFCGLAAAIAAGLESRAAAASGVPVDALYARAIVIDGLGGPGGQQTELGAPLSAAELTDVRASGLTACNLTVGGVGNEAPLAAFERIVRDIARWEGEIDRHPDVLARVRTVADIREAKRTGRLGLVYGLQDGVSFEDDLERMTALHQLGIRVIQPTYNRRNLLGDGSMEPADAGLSRDGVAAVARMNELGILVDLSHCGRRTALDAIRASSKPVAFTHTGCAAVADHPRNRTDAELRELAERGGVAGIYVMPYLAGGRQPRASDVVAHVEHAWQVCGEDHVAIGTDGTLSPVALTPEFVEAYRKNVQDRKAAGIAAPGETEDGYLFASDLNTARRLETLAELLADRGHTAARIEKLLGANLLRVFGDAWGR